MNVSEEQCFESIKLEQYFETMLAKHCDVLGFTIVLGKNNVLNFLEILTILELGLNKSDVSRIVEPAC